MYDDLVQKTIKSSNKTLDEYELDGLGAGIQAEFKQSSVDDTFEVDEEDDKTKNIYKQFDLHIRSSGFEVAYDTTINANVRRKVGSSNNWVKIDKRFIDDLLSNFKQRMSEREVGIYLNSYGRKNEFSSFEQYLESVKGIRKKYKNKNRTTIESIFIECYGADDTALTRQASQIFVCSIIAKQIYERVQTRIVPVLVGKQEQGKSNLGIWVLPAQLQDYAKLDFHITDDDRNNVQEIQNSITVELGELAGSRRFNDRLKGFISKQFDKIVPKFSNRSEILPRRAVFYATSNEQNPLSNDPSGHSRFVIIQCQNETGEGVKEWIEEHRDEMFSHGHRLVQQAQKRGELYQLLKLESDQLQQQREINRQFEFNPNSLVDELVSEYINDYEEWEYSKLATFVRERVKSIRETQSIGTVNTGNVEISKSLTRLGWDKRHTDKGNVWVNIEKT